jgi:hypothetical protein
MNHIDVISILTDWSDVRKVLSTGSALVSAACERAEGSSSLRVRQAFQPSLLLDNGTTNVEM